MKLKLKQLFDEKSYAMSAEECLRLRRDLNHMPIIIDVRSPEEYQEKHLTASYSIPAEYFDEYIDQMPPNLKVILYGGVKHELVVDCLQQLTERQFEDVHYVSGGFDEIDHALHESSEEVFLTDFSPERWQNQIEQVLDQKVKPILEADGGGMEVDEIRGDRVFIKYQGACDGCPSAASGELRFIKQILRISLNHPIQVEIAS